jgi:hypothetical protein
MVDHWLTNFILDMHKINLSQTAYPVPLCVIIDVCARRHAADIAFLRATILLLKGDLQAARRHLLLALHRQPWLAALWQVLAQFLLQNVPAEAAAAAAVSRRAGLMEQHGSGGGATRLLRDTYPDQNQSSSLLGGFFQLIHIIQKVKERLKFFWLRFYEV